MLYEPLHLKLRETASCCYLQFRDLQESCIRLYGDCLEFCRCEQFLFVVGAGGAHCTPTLFRSFNLFTPVRTSRRPATRG